MGIVLSPWLEIQYILAQANEKTEEYDKAEEAALIEADFYPESEVDIDVRAIYVYPYEPDFLMEEQDGNDLPDTPTR